MIVPLLDTLQLTKIDDSEYFSEKYSDYISNSRLSLIDPLRDGSPEKFFAGHTKVFSTSLENGSAVHELCLQPELFELAPDLDKPTAKVGFIADLAYEKSNGAEKPSEEILRECASEVQYYQKAFTASRIEDLYTRCTSYWKRRKVYENERQIGKTPIFLDTASIRTVTSCVKSLARNKNVQNLLHPDDFLEEVTSKNETAVLVDLLVDNEFTLKFKAKLDNFTIQGNTITVNDVKTLGKILSEFSGNVDRYSYNRELSIYSWLLSLCAEKFYNIEDPIIKANYLVVSTIPQYYSKVVPMTKRAFEEGWQDFVRLINLVAQYVREGYVFK